MSVERKWAFVDTHILVYAHDRSAKGKRQRAAKLIQALWDDGAGCLSVQVLQEFYVTVTLRVPKPLDHSMGYRIVSDLSAWKTHEPTAQDVLKVAEIKERYKLSFWDAMIICSAAALGCTVLWSEDLKEGETYEGVCVRNPFR